MAKNPMDSQRRYLAFLLRLWQESSDDPLSWRASLESPRSDEHQRFPGLDELFAYLRERTDMPSPADDIVSHERTPETDSEAEED